MKAAFTPVLPSTLQQPDQQHDSSQAISRTSLKMSSMSSFSTPESLRSGLSGHGNSLVTGKLPSSLDDDRNIQSPVKPAIKKPPKEDSDRLLKRGSLSPVMTSLRLPTPPAMFIPGHAGSLMSHQFMSDPLRYHELMDSVKLLFWSHHNIAGQHGFPYSL